MVALAYRSSQLFVHLSSNGLKQGKPHHLPPCAAALLSGLNQSAFSSYWTSAFYRALNRRSGWAGRTHWVELSYSDPS